MSSDVTANSRTVVHKGDGIVNVSALPDVCKTPTPAGPTPVPYPNVARDADLADGAKHVTIEGNPVALESSQLKRSSGDEAGTLGGVVSGKNRGKMTWGTSSSDVSVEGKGVIRFADLTHHNCNTYNVFKMQKGARKRGDIINYGDDANCPICGHPAPPHPILSDEGEKVSKEMKKLFNKLKTEKQRQSDEKKALEKEIDDKQKKKDMACNDGRIPTDQWKRLEDELGELKTKENALANKGPLADRFMVAVLTCDCGLIFSAISGSAEIANPATFCEIAKSLGHKTEDGLVAPVWDRLLSLKSPKLLRLDKTSTYQAIAEHKVFVKDFLKGRIVPPESNKKIGGCAAPRVIALAIQGGHRPEHMSERWFSPFERKLTKQSSVTRRYHGVAEFERPHRESPPDVAAERKEREFSHGKNVTSCDTCKKQVPALLCVELPECAPKGKK